MARPLLLHVLGVGALLILIAMTAGTLAVASSCSVPLHEGGRASAPVLRQGVQSVATRMRSILRRLAGGTVGGGSSGSAYVSGRPVSAEAAALAGNPAAQVDAAKRLLLLLDSSVGARALGPSAFIARALAEGVLAKADAATLAAAAASSATLGRISSDAPTWADTALYSQQTCHITADESELCTYEGVLCFDGEGPVVIVEQPSAPESRVDDHSASCLDSRFLEASAMEFTACDLEGATAPPPQRLVNATRVDIQHDSVLPLGRRRWGPLNRGGGVTYREVHPSQVWGDDPQTLRDLYHGVPVPPDTPALAGLSRSDVTLELAPSTSGGAHPLSNIGGTDVATRIISSDVGRHPSVPGLRLRALTSVSGRSIAWVDGALWITGLDAGDAGNAMVWLERIGSLYEAQRSNATPHFGDHPKDGFMHFQESWQVASSQSIYMEPPMPVRASYKVGSQWPVPPLDVVAFTGAGALEVPSAMQLPSWFSSTLSAAVQPTSAVFFDDLREYLRSAAGGAAGGTIGTRKKGDGALVCSALGGGVTGTKPKLFSGRMDGLMWKQYAYQSTGLSVEGVKPHPRYPPRRLTILESSSMGGESSASGGVWNIDALVATVEASGIPYVRVPTLDGLSFDETVRLMASTGILVSAHGAALGNAVFLPAHAVVIELFPYGAKSNAVRHLAAMTDLHYLPVFSWERVALEELEGGQGRDRLLALSPATPLENAKLIYSEDYWRACESQNKSGYDAVVDPVCFEASRAHPVVLNQSAFATALRDAIDCSASFSLKNPDWAALADAEGQPVRPAPNRSRDEDRFGING